MRGDGCGSPELELYLTRVEIVGRAVIGSEFYELMQEAEQTPKITNWKWSRLFMAVRLTFWATLAHVSKGSVRNMTA